MRHTTQLDLLPNQRTGFNRAIGHALAHLEIRVFFAVRTNRLLATHLAEAIQTIEFEERG